MKRETEAILIKLNRGQREKLKRRATLDKMTMQAFVESLIETAIVTKPTKRGYTRKNVTQEKASE